MPDDDDDSTQLPQVNREATFYEAMAQHVEEMHGLELDPDDIRRWISEHGELMDMKPTVQSTHRIVRGIVDEMHGPLVDTSVGTIRSGGFVELIEQIDARQTDVLDRLENGGIKVRLSKGAWAAITALITAGISALAIVIVAAIS